MPQTALITGAADRLGAIMARGLAQRGFTVAIHYRHSASKAEALAAAIRETGGTAVTVQGDLSEADAQDRLVNEVVDQIGPIGLLINNASIFGADRAGDFSREQMQAHHAIHVEAPAVLSRHFANALPEDAEGLIVNMIDERVLRPRPAHFTYALSKSALWAMTQTLAQTYAPRIRVNAIGPGPSLPTGGEGEDGFTAKAADLPLGRAPAPGEFVAALEFLVAARSVTGQILLLDGGRQIDWRVPGIAP